MAPIPLGHIVRFERDRVHPESLPLEAVDVLRKIIEGRRRRWWTGRWRICWDLSGDGGGPVTQKPRSGTARSCQQVVQDNPAS